LRHHFQDEEGVKLPVIGVRPYECGTFTDFMEYAKIAHGHSSRLLLSPQNSDTLDASIVDLAVATSSILNIGAPLKYEK
jgi:enolase